VFLSVESGTWPAGETVRTGESRALRLRALTFPGRYEKFGAKR
jgi:hypothetical protein